MPSIFRHLTYCKMGSIPVRVTKKEAIRKDGFFFGDWYVGANLSGSTARFFAARKQQTKILDESRGFLFGAGGRTRTGTPSLAVDFESTTSTNSITPA